jgi:DNA replication protein DnaC
MKTSECRACGRHIEYEPVEFMPRWLIPTICEDCETGFMVEQKQKRFEFRFKNSNLPPMYKSWDATLGNRELLLWVKQYSQRSLILRGPTGTCKTRCLCRQACIEMWHNENIVVKFVPAVDFTRHTTSVMASDPHYAELIIERVHNSDIVLLDDIGQEKYTERQRQVLFSIIDNRIRTGRRLWVTTNIIGQLDIDISGRIDRRLNEYCLPYYTLKGDSPCS